MTAPAHPVVFRPVIERLQHAGHDVLVTARDYAQTLPLLDRLGIPYVAIGRHGGASRARKGAALASRSRRMIGYGRAGALDLAGAPRAHELAGAAPAPPGTRGHA